MQRIERSSIRCKCFVPETFKHSWPIKPLIILVTCISASGTSFSSVCRRY